VAADGSFVLNGVTPKNYQLTIRAPGLKCKHTEEIHIPRDLEKAKKLDGFEFELARPHALAVDCGIEYAGHTAELVAAEKIDSEKAADFTVAAEGTVDAEGRAEFDGLIPGKYVLLLNPDEAQFAMTGMVAENFTQMRAGPFES